MSEPKEPSEFGAGLVVCLVKFSEHLNNEWMVRARNIYMHLKQTDEEKDQQRTEAEKHPLGDAARSLLDVDLYLGGTTTWASLSHALELWANGASDHFYDLDRANAPADLVTLADLTLAMGHGFTGKIWTWDHVDQIYDLWKKSALALDERCGTKPEWGQW